MNPLRVFISYAKEDRQAARRLDERLLAEGYQTWFDERDILPGQRWSDVIRTAIRDSNVAIICLSNHSTKNHGYYQKEIKFALDAIEEKPADDVYLIPVRLEECPVPERLLLFQWVDLFGNREKESESWGKLLSALEEASRRLDIRTQGLKRLLNDSEQALLQIIDVPGLGAASSVTSSLPLESGYSPETQKRINRISELARDYQKLPLSVGKVTLLAALRHEVTSFRRAMTLTSDPIGAKWQSIGLSWLEIIAKAEEELRKRVAFRPILNPFISGAPLQAHDHELLKGRREVIRAIEKYIISDKQQLSLLLFGRRRTGKSSTLLNLPLLLSSQFELIYIDCQDAKWHESDQAFCYNLAREIFERLFQSDDVKGVRQPQEAKFEKNAFTRLDEYLDQFERLATERGKRILLAFDEYEGLEESIAGGNISKNVLGKLRNIIQHRQRFVVLVSGSHRFEELTGVNWASYLINTRTLELSFLDEPSARELLTEPVPKLRYEDGVLEEILRLTHCQPYLLQAVASELVNHLNELQKTTAERADLDAAVNKVLTSAGAYFANTWREDNSATEQTVLRAYAEGAGERVAAAEFQSALQSLIRKEMMERDGDGYRLAVPLFGLWILRNQVD